MNTLYFVDNLEIVGLVKDILRILKDKKIRV
jgi:hypothetical protein